MELFDTVGAFASALAPIIWAVIQVTKKSFSIRKNYVPAIALFVGLLIGAAAVPFTDLALVERLWAGGLGGLLSTGLFELWNKREGFTTEKEGL